MADLYCSTLAKRILFSTILPFVLFACSAFKNYAGFDNRPIHPGRVSEAAELQLRNTIIDYARTFLGIKYRYAGTSARTGFDCSGFTSHVLRSFDIKVSPSSSTQSTQGDLIPLDEVEAGDLIFFGYRGRVSHVALVVGRRPDGIYCVHSTCSRGVIVENVTASKYWRPKILFARDVISKQELF